MTRSKGPITATIDSLSRRGTEVRADLLRRTRALQEELAVLVGRMETGAVIVPSDFRHLVAAASTLERTAAQAETIEATQRILAEAQADASKRKSRRDKARRVGV